MGIGLSYKIFPFVDPLSFWGQSHFVLNATIEALTARYQIRDNFVLLEDTTTAKGVRLECNYYFPIRYNIWAYLGMAFLEQTYKFSNIGVDYDKNYSTTAIGVSYGF